MAKEVSGAVERAAERLTQIANWEAAGGLHEPTLRLTARLLLAQDWVIRARDRVDAAHAACVEWDASGQWQPLADERSDAEAGLSAARAVLAAVQSKIEDHA